MALSFENLAVFGAVPTFPEKLHVGRSNIGDRTRLMERFNDILDSRWLTNNGSYVQDLEQHIAGMMGVRHCIAICNATIALEITIRALGLEGEVIIPSFTFIATAHSLQWQQIRPVFCDIDPKTHNLDPDRVEELITSRTTGIMGVHLWGRPSNVQALTKIAQKHGLKLMFDAAHAFGCSLEGQMIGGFGDAEVFSFHATKFFNTLEGGAVLTNNDELDTKIRLMKNFGFEDYDTVNYIGTNGKMNEMSAAMGLTSLESLDEFIATNRHNYQCYRNGLKDIQGIQLLTYDESEKCNYQYIVLEVDEEKTKISRDNLLKVLFAENVLARRYFYPGCHRMEPYRSNFPGAGAHLPVTEYIADRVLVLPTGTAVGKTEIQKICDILRCAVNRGSELSRRLEKTL